jgi:small neutral amino acid transporter SnatA (MarC family)
VDRSIDVAFVVDTFLLLLIGVGPKIAFVPFVEITAGLDDATKQRVTRKMLTTAGIVAGILLVLGELLTRLLHFSPGALSIAGGIVLLIISISMILGTGVVEDMGASTGAKGPMLLAAFPLAIPYLLNPAGIVAIVTLSAESDSASTFGVVLGLVAFVLALDVVVFRLANRLSKHLDESRMLITEKVFGFLLAALAVQLILNGLSETGVIHLTGH